MNVSTAIEWVKKFCTYNRGPEGMNTFTWLHPEVKLSTAMQIAILLDLSYNAFSAN